MQRVIVSLLLLVTPTVAVAQPADAEAAVKAKVEAALAAIRANDADKAMAGWPEKAPGRTAFRNRLESILPPPGETAKTLDVEFFRWKVDGKEATARVRFVRVCIDKAGIEWDRDAVVWDVRFVKGDAWDWVECTYAVAKLARDLRDAKNKQEQMRLLQANKDIPLTALTHELIQHFEALLQVGEVAAAKRMFELQSDIAKLANDPLADAWVDYSLAVLLETSGRPADAAKVYEASLKRFIEKKNRFGELALRTSMIDALVMSGRFDDALEHSGKAISMAKAQGYSYGLAMAQNNHAVALKMLGRYGEAVEHYQIALKIFQELMVEDDQGMALNNIGEVEQLRGNQAEAIEALNATYKIGVRVNNKRLQAQALLNLGMVDLDRARYEEALAKLQKSVELFEKLNHLNGLAMALNGLAMVHLGRGAIDDAISQFKQNRTQAQKTKNLTLFVFSAIGLGDAQRRKGDYGDAILTLSEALRDARKLNDRPSEAKALLNLGVTYFFVGQLALAVESFENCEVLADKIGERGTQAIALMNLGIVLNLYGKPEKARENYLKALKLARTTGQLELEIKTLLSLSQLDGKPEERLRVLREALDRIGPKGGLLMKAILRNRLGTAYLRLGQDRNAEPEFAQAIKLAEQIGALEEVFMGHLGLGDVFHARRQLKEAVAEYRLAVAAAEGLHQNAQDPGLQMGVFQTHTALYQRLAECLTELGEPDQAFETCERVKGRTLARLLQTGQGNVVKHLSPEKRKEEQTLVQKLSERSNLVVALATSKSADAKKLALARQREWESQKDLDAFRRDLYIANSRLQTDRAEFTPADLKQLGATLFRARPGLVVLSYLVGPEQMLLFVLTAGENPGDPARLAVHKVKVKEETLREAVSTFGGGCKTPGALPESKDLIGWLLDPVEKTIENAKELVIVPDGMLHQLPFQALRGEDNKYLIERCAISYAPSITALVKMTEAADQRRKDRNGNQVLAVGIGDFGTREKALTAAEPEAQAIGDLFREKAGRPTVALLLLGKDATKAKVRAEWSDRRYLHFATHGEFNQISPLYSSILLTSDSKDEGRLYARDLLDVDLKAELVVLSACQTGVGVSVWGEGLVGMSWSWFVAGVPSLVVSQWNVDDKSTATLMRTFYAQLLGGATKAESLRQAQIKLLKEKGTRHPFYWAPFILLGDSRE